MIAIFIVLPMGVVILFVSHPPRPQPDKAKYRLQGTLGIVPASLPADLDKMLRKESRQILAGHVSDETITKIINILYDRVCWACAGCVGKHKLVAVGPERRGHPVSAPVNFLS